MTPLPTGSHIRKLVDNGLIIRKPNLMHSRFRARAFKEARSKGRHTGFGLFSLRDPKENELIQPSCDLAHCICHSISSI